ncbi:YceI family protein [Novacetimonas hansenii]|nr:YceI family protein [Novacetimonas hansenii]WEQ59570.1 YceI family protein [Novacetimonas hansenii]
MKKLFFRQFYDEAELYHMNYSFLSLPATALAFALVTGNTASAQVVTSAAQAQSGTYDVEPGHTQVGFSVLHFGFTNYLGIFSNVSGTLILDPKNPTTSKLSVTIPVDSVQTTSSKLNDELKGTQWFDAAKFPNATFESTSIHVTGRNDALVAGNLTLHGVTKPETLKVHFIGAGINALDKKYTTGFEATGTLKRSDFGVKMYVPYVSDEVQLRINGAFEKQG